MRTTLQRRSSLGVTIVELVATLGAMVVLGGLVAGGVATARTSARGA